MYQTILIDDEPHCLQSIEFLLNKYFPEVHVLARCSDGEAALAALQTHKPDFIFIDIEMPLLNGFQVLEKLENFDFSIIFTTAYSRYAVRAFRFSALDYLLKPVDSDEFREAVNRAIERKSTVTHAEQLQLLDKNLSSNNSVSLKKIALPHSDGLIFLETEKITFCESDGNYSRLHFETSKPVLVTKSLKIMEEMLVDSGFFRIHKQYLVNLHFIERYIRGEGGQVVLSTGEVLTVARNRRDDFLANF